MATRFSFFLLMLAGSNMMGASLERGEDVKGALGARRATLCTRVRRLRSSINVLNFRKLRLRHALRAGMPCEEESS